MNLSEIPKISQAEMIEEIDLQISQILPPTEKDWEKKAKIQNPDEENQEKELDKSQDNQEIDLDSDQGKSPELKDKEGLTFDSRIHEQSNGEPRNFHGFLKRKKGWQKFIDEVKKDQIVEIEPPEPDPIIEPENEEPILENGPISEDDLNSEEKAPLPPRLNEMSNRYLAELIAGLFIGIGVSKFGDEWHPLDLGDGKTDKDEIVLSWEAYLEEKRAGEKIPSWLAPWLTMGSYAVTRITTKPKTRQGFYDILGKTKTRLVGWYGYIKGRWFTSKPETEEVK